MFIEAMVTESGHILGGNVHSLIEIMFFEAIFITMIIRFQAIFNVMIIFFEAIFIAMIRLFEAMIIVLIMF